MAFPLLIQFLEPPASDVEARIREKFRGLGRFSDRILSCHVWVEKPRGHHRKGFLYQVHVRLFLPGEEIDIVAQPSEEDVFVAVRNAYDAVRRKLQDHERRLRGRTKAHPRRRARSARPAPAVA